MSTIIIAVIIVIIPVGFFFVFRSISKKNAAKRNRSLADLLSQAGSKHDLSFSGQEVLTSKIIGLDGVNRILLILDIGNNRNEILINMPEVKSVKVNKEFKNINMGTEKSPKPEKHLQLIDLVFYFKTEHEPVSVRFYEAGVNSVFEIIDLEAKAMSWEALVFKMISKEVMSRA